MDIGLLMIAGGVAAGLIGSLLGLGGGILIVPLLTLVFDLPVREAVGVSLVCVIMTSAASASVFLQRRIANLRLGMVLELFTAIGAVAGGTIAFLLDERILAGLFSALLVYTAVTMARHREPSAASTAVPATVDPAAHPEAPVAGGGDHDRHVTRERPSERQAFLDRLAGADYHLRRPVAGAFGSVVAGVLSALLGVGGGVVKVPVMHVVMGIPLRVATATSNLMIGITASTSAIVYLVRGGIDAYAAGPTALGVFAGASLGSRVAHRIDVRVLRLLFVVILLVTAVQMIRRAVGVL